MTRITGQWLAAPLLAGSVLWAGAAEAAAYSADPTTYKSVLPTLLPGDTLNLEAGTYPLLKISGLQGTPDAWITVQGPPSGPPAVVIGYRGHNTVELVNASYLAVRNLRIDSRWIRGAFGLSAKDGAANLVHDVLVEDCVFVGQGGSQQTDAISTKTPTWNWTIRGNVIVGAGVGLYLGASDGSDPFVAGLIEGNLIANPVLYGGQIKWQQTRPAVPGMPAGPSRTIIRHNVFIKGDGACARPFGCAPNLLVGGFPDAGSGSEDLYEIYGNLFYNNPRESLLQASGRVSVHDNLFVNKAPGQAAILLRDHDLPLKLAHVYDNTIYESVDPRFLNPAVGIRVASVPREGQAITGNLVLAQLPIVGYTPDLSGNVTDLPADAGLYVTSPSTTLGSADFHPLATGAARGEPVDLSAFAAEDDYDLDFDGRTRDDAGFRGAYAGPSHGPSWHFSASRKPLPAARSRPAPNHASAPGFP